MVMVDSFLGVEDCRICLPFDDQDTCQSFFSPSQRVIDNEVVAGVIHLKLHHGRSTRRYQRCLYIRQRRHGEGCLVIYTIESLPDHMVACREIGPTYTNDYAHSLTDVGSKLVRS